MAKVAKKRATKKTRSRAKATKAPAPEVPVKAAAGKAAPVPALASFEDLERAFENLFNRAWLRPFGMEWPRLRELSSALERQVPSVDVVDRPKEVYVRAELPGINKNDLDVTIAERMLTIKGSSRKEEKEEKEDYFRQEITSGAFSRSILLPADVNPAKAEASFKNGVLELHLPKVRVAPRKQVPLT